MGYLEPTVALTTCEQALRDLYRHAYQASHGSGWLQAVSTEDQRVRWDERQTEEEQRRHITGRYGTSRGTRRYA